MYFTRSADTAQPRPWLWYTVIGLALIAVSHTILPTAGDTLIYDFFCLSATLAVFWRGRDPRTAGRHVWHLLALAMGLLTIGNVAWTIDEVVRDIAIPFPSLADAIFLGAFPIAAAALVMLSRQRGRGSDRGTMLDAAIVGLGFGVASWFCLFDPYLKDANYPLLERLVSAAYPGLEILVVGALAFLVLAPGERTPAFLLLVGGVTIYVCTNVLYARDLLLDTYGSAAYSSWMMSAWMIGTLVWGAAALHPSSAHLACSTGPRHLVLTRGRLALLSIAALAVPTIQVLGVSRDSAVDRYVMFGTTGLLFLLVVLRLAGLVNTIAGSERRFRALVQNGSDLIAILEPDIRFRYASPSFHEVLGYDPEALIGRAAAPIVVPSELPRVRSSFSQIVATPGSQITFEADLLHADGSIRTVEATAISLLDDADIGGLIVNARDITARKHASEALRAAQSLNSSVIESSVDGIFAIDTNSSLTVWNRAMERTTGLPRDHVLGQNLMDLFPFLRSTGEASLVVAALHGEAGRAPVQPNTIEDTGKHGFYEARYAPLTDEASAVVGAIGVVRDVTAQKALEAELEHQAFHDALTGLPNRALFANRLEHALALGSRRGTSVAVLLLDLDRFKLVNDGLGHAAGDQLLVAVAERLTTRLRDADTLARIGGDEFVVLLDEATPEQSEAVAERIIVALSDPITVQGRDVFIGTSIGIAVSTPDFADPVELLRASDIALYRAKSAGRQTVMVFDPMTADPSAGWLALEVDLRRAVSRRELVLHYQPVIDLTTGQVVTVEALARWTHPIRGLLLPSAFIPLAEETGLITTITEWAIADACRQLARWRTELGDLAPPTVNINVTTRDLRDPELVDRVASALSNAGIEPPSLRLEITERVLIEELREAAGTLRALRDLGVKLAIDDFGAGASSLASLRAVNAEVLKLDRAFVRGLDDNPDDRIVVNAVVAMAHALGIAVTAEGIETVAQREQARAAGCDRGQGYLFAQPMPAKELAAWLVTHAAQPATDEIHRMFDRSPTMIGRHQP